MFASLLPGLRDLRTPLAVGLLWLMLLWVWFAHLIPEPDAASGLLAQLYRLSGIFGSAVLLTMLSFAGYVLGLLLSSLHVDWRPVRAVLPEMLRPLSWQSSQLLVARYRVAIDKASEGGVTQDEIERFGDGVIDRGSRSLNVESDIRLIAMRLQGTQKDIYDDYDRFRSEAEFRRSIALPLSGLLVSVILNVTVLRYGAEILAWIAGVLLFISIHVLSWRKSREGNDLVIQSLLSGQVQSPTIEAFNELTASAKKRRIEARARKSR